MLVGLVAIVLLAVVAGPWLLYEFGLSKIDGRPGHAVSTAVAPEDVEALIRTLRISRPITIDRLSPYSYIWTLARSDGRMRDHGVRIAWRIARSHNADHLANHSFWHLSGAALTIWLTRNWTTDELVAKAVELEKATAKARAAAAFERKQSGR
ncbi:hypothetical protein [Rhodoplanes sp. Z2-YC6860]|uniref:hypothetical protein n=1 Tax=Rhodoplanes sp. Z2-YC6860 TaxID=674703 RepID=UPI000833650F|nr:hypothetical protein [Rhodoplanes sp. Z2-YC6860]